MKELTKESLFRISVSKPDGCIVWIGARTSRGYGSFALSGDSSKKYAAHRESYRLHHGEIPPGKIVMHTCDNPSCINPDHLQLGTKKENTQDAIKKGRFTPGSYQFRSSHPPC